jgi:hypothetical protein
MDPIPKPFRDQDGLVTLETVDASVLAELLAMYERELVQLGVPVREYLRPGLERREVVLGLAELGLSAPEELIAWFGWQDGLREKKPGEVYPEILQTMFPCSLESALKRYNDTRPGEGDPPIWCWAPEWLMLEDGAYGFAVSCEDAPTHAPVVRFVDEANWIHGPQTKWGARSLSTLVVFWIEMLRNGASQWADNHWVWDVSALSQLQRDSGLA